MCSSQTSSGPVWHQAPRGTFTRLYWIQDLSKKGLHWYLSTKVQCWYCLLLLLHWISWLCCCFSQLSLLLIFVLHVFFLFWVSVWQKTFGERKAWHVDIEVTVCGMHLIIRRLWRPLHFLYSDSCSVVTPECLHAGIMLLPDSSLKPSLTETELLLDYLSRHQHDMYVSQDTTLVLLQALDISTLDHSHVLLAYIIFQVISLQLIQNATVFQIFTLPKRPTATLPRLASCSSLHQIQVPDVTLQRQVCTGTCLLPRLWWNLFHSSKNCQIYCLPGALLSWRSSQTWGNPVLCSCSHLQWIPVEIKTAETCTSSSKSKTCLLKNKGNFKKNGEMTFFYFSSTDPALCVLHPTTPASCSGHMFTPCGT